MSGERWVVVGAGSAGCVVASRLSEDPDRDVVLLESGPALDSTAVPSSIGGPDFLAAMAEPGRMHRALEATRNAAAAPSRYWRGRGVGGSSVVNAMVALRGDPAQYERWGWSGVREAWEAVRLPVEVPRPEELGPVDRALLTAAPDARLAPLSRRAGRRVTSAEAYLWPAADRPNLTIRPDVAVGHVEFTGRRVTGVRMANGEILSADRVVLAAGAIHSPALLLRSGVDTPGVGRGLLDHPSAPLTLRFVPGLDAGSGLGSNPGLVLGTVLERGAIQVLPMNHLGPDAPGYGLLMVALMRPYSSGGTVELRSDDVADDPIVRFRLLEDRRDVVALRDGVTMVLDLLRSPPFSEIVDDVFIDDAGTRATTLTDVARIDAWLHTAGGGYVHATSSCAMGEVVDDDGSLRGYDGVYVCDASVFPEIPDVNTHLPTTMLAERLAARWRAAA